MKKRGPTAANAVDTSIINIVWMGIISRKRAPRGGATMFARPMRLWFRPATLLRFSFGTMMEVVACMAVQWNAPPIERTNMATKMCHICMVPVM